MKFVVFLALLTPIAPALSQTVGERVIGVCKYVFLVNWLAEQRAAREQAVRAERDQQLAASLARQEQFARETFRIVVPRDKISNPVDVMVANVITLENNPNYVNADRVKEETRIFAAAIARGAYGRDVFESLIRAEKDLGSDPAYSGAHAQVLQWIVSTSSTSVNKLGKGAIFQPWIVRYNGALVDLANTTYDNLPVDVKNVFFMAGQQVEWGFPAASINFMFRAAFTWGSVSEQELVGIRGH